jgi:hypothetical protein
VRGFAWEFDGFQERLLTPALEPVLNFLRE